MSDGHTLKDVRPVPASRAYDRTVVNVRVGEVVLTGLPLTHVETARVRTALQQELGALLAAQDLPQLLQSGGSAPSLPGTALRIAEWRDAADLGRQIARALHGGLQR